jgi:hypothetical protein
LIGRHDRFAGATANRRVGVGDVGGGDEEVPVVDADQFVVELVAAVGVLHQRGESRVDGAEGLAESGEGGVQGVGGSVRAGVGPQRGYEGVAVHAVRVCGEVDEQFGGAWSEPGDGGRGLVAGRVGVVEVVQGGGSADGQSQRSQRRRLSRRRRAPAPPWRFTRLLPVYAPLTGLARPLRHRQRSLDGFE